MIYRNLNWIILFGGVGREAIIQKLHQDGIKIVKIILPKIKNKNFNISKKKLEIFNSIIDTSNINNLSGKLSGIKNSGIISIGFPFIIPKAIYSKHLIALNIHPTLLPKYRGPTSGAYVFINEEKYSGSTVHLMEENPDSGPILAQSKVEIKNFDNILSLKRKVYETEPKLLLEALKRLDNNFKLKPQDEKIASYYPKIRKPKDSLIDPKLSLNELIPFLKACDPDNYPAYFFYKGQKVCLKIWRPDKPKNEFDSI